MRRTRPALPRCPSLSTTVFLVHGLVAGAACTRAVPPRGAHAEAPVSNGSGLEAPGLRESAQGDPADTDPVEPGNGRPPLEGSDAAAGSAPPISPSVAPEVRYAFNDPLVAPGFPANAPALRTANLSPGECRAELARRKLPVKRYGGATPGVATALRIDGPFGGVRFMAPGGKSPYGILDCRLALLLDELAPLLADHGVVAVRVDNFYRPRARLPGRRRTPSQHAHGLAIDITGFVLADGRVLEVERDWPAQEGEPACGDDARPSLLTAEAIELRNLVCEIARRGFFHDVLTPNYDRAHHNHLHLDIKRGVRWGAVR